MAGLAREVEELSRLVERLVGLPDRVAELGDVVARLADELATHPSTPRTSGPPSWLALAPERQPSAMLSDLIGWLATVYLRFPDGAHHLPECWLWHPDVVEELHWLRLVWAIAHHPELGSPMLVGDWHDRYRPGVVRRVRERSGTCSLERHRDEAVGAAPVVPLADAAEVIAHWWADGRLSPAPVPTDEHLAAADRQRRNRAGRR